MKLEMSSLKRRPGTQSSTLSTSTNLRPGSGKVESDGEDIPSEEDVRHKRVINCLNQLQSLNLERPEGVVIRRHHHDMLHIKARSTVGKPISCIFFLLIPKKTKC